VTILLSYVNFTNQVAYRSLDVAISVFAVCLYGFYLIYDVQLIAGGERFSLSLDDYIIGALVIYIDIIVLFLRILRILAEIKRR